MKLEYDESLCNAVYIPYLTDNTRVQIFFGGSSSGKSYFLCSRAVLDALQGRNYLILRNVANTLRNTVWNEVVKAISSMGLMEWFSVGKSEMTITAVNNGAQIMFAGLDDVEKIKGINPAHGIVTDIWIEEATETAYEDYKQLEKRLRGKQQGKETKTKRITLSFNPIFREHWIYKQFFQNWDESKTSYKDDGMSILKTTYKDNRFLEPEDIKALEDEKDSYYFNVYTLGNWGVLGDVIFRNWRSEDLSEMNTDKPLFGLDFGFSSDPAAGVKVHYDRAQKKIYILDELWEKGLTNNHLAELLKPWVGGHYITCDSSEPKSIKELQNLGIRALGAKKGPDSVIHGIQWLQGHQIIVDSKCQRMKNELQLYQWRKDKNGQSMRVPEDRNNHLIDALRYCLEHESTARYATSLNLKGL
ncbi:MAG: PBSX family phage terminase large subunit [Candidatus Sumerlaeales bacterium]|nr:PBSX family phage terminase large subunit [Candidatus Sumerlaeales bacterium]